MDGVTLLLDMANTMHNATLQHRPAKLEHFVTPRGHHMIRVKSDQQTAEYSLAVAAYVVANKKSQFYVRN